MITKEMLSAMDTEELLEGRQSLKATLVELDGETINPAFRDSLKPALLEFLSYVEAILRLRLH